MSDKRNAERHDVRVLAKYRTGRGYQSEAQVVDLSETGCRMFQKRTPLDKGNKLSMRIGAMGPFDAMVAWVERDMIGVQFVNPLYGPVFDHIRSVVDNREWRP